MKAEYSSDRTFVVWQYSVFHHGGVLLRSSRRGVSDRRVDLHFASVEALFVRPVYQGITVREGTEAERERVTDMLGTAILESDRRLHVIGKDVMAGFVVGGPLQVHEKHADDSQPSGFLRMPPTP
ncbi:hypothetical protein [Streptomyces sp. NPDC085937]|uniref:hypothetical protein n=1 Tax=Streptomyces sp. NPDC085937 TaxID=3365742 RepID=UPI0037CCF7EF